MSPAEKKSAAEFERLCRRDEADFEAAQRAVKKYNATLALWKAHCVAIAAGLRGTFNAQSAEWQQSTAGAMLAGQIAEWETSAREAGELQLTWKYPSQLTLAEVKQFPQPSEGEVERPRSGAPREGA